VKLKIYIPIALLIITFIIIKSASFGVRLSDTNIYFFTGYKLLEGQVLYRDIFFTNFPLLPYLSSIYFLLTGGSLSLFFLTPVIEVSAVSFLIYLITKEKTGNTYLSITSSVLYLFSFIILSTSDHQTGVFFASLAAVLSYYFYLHKRFLVSGIFIALTLLTKVYFLPIFLALLTIFIIDREWKQVLRFIIGAVVTGIIIMLPTLIFAFSDFINNVFMYSLTRSQGIEKSGIIWFFITHDFLLFVLLLFNLFNIKNNRFFGLVSLFGILFVFVYKDVYYLYLNFLIPFLALSFPEFYEFIQKNFHPQKAILPTILVPFIFYSIITYVNGFQDLQKINNLSEITNAIKNENPKVLYGVNDIAPVLSYTSGVPLLNNIIDTNSNIYRKGILNAKKLTNDAIAQKGMIIAHGVYYPEYGVEEAVVDEIFDKEQVKKSCKLVKSFPIKMEGPENRLNLLRCY
jgi:drug/metabolite transporter superfamily protein YnfA